MPKDILLPASFYEVHSSEPKSASHSVCGVSSGAQGHNESFLLQDRKSKLHFSSQSSQSQGFKATFFTIFSSDLMTPKLLIFFQCYFICHKSLLCSNGCVFKELDELQSFIS